MTTIALMRQDEARRRAARRQFIFEQITLELEHAYEKHGSDLWGRHEWYAITLEELDEAWDAVKADAPADELEAEIIQVAAMCIRYLEQRRDRYGEEPE